MRIHTTTLLAGAFALCAFAAPLPAAEAVGCEGVKPQPLTAATLIAIAPETTACSGSGEFADECADATRAAPAINTAFTKYGVNTTGEQAALIAYMLFESGNFKYKRNHFPAPGRPGQGTRMMAMAPVVEKYATSVVGADNVAKAKVAGGDAALNAVLALVNSDDEKSFGSAAWYLTTCTPAVRQGLVAETTDGWHAFLTECVETTLDPLRDAPWVRAKQFMNGV